MKRYLKIVAIVGTLLAIAAYSAAEFIPDGLAGSAEAKVSEPGAPASAASETARPVPLYVVKKDDSKEERSYPGVTQATNEVDLSFRVAGPLVEVNVAPGSVVKKGQSLMQIDPRDFQDEIAVLEAQLAGAKADYDNAKAELERYKPLMKKSVVSKSDFDGAERVYATAQAQMKHISAQLRIAKHKLEDTCLRAPFDGIVTSQFVENHEMVTAGQNALKMHDISKVEIHVNIPENDLGNYDLGKKNKVQVLFPAIPGKVYNAEMVEWSAEADPVTRTYEVTFGLPAPDDKLILPGMTAEVRWQGDTDNAPVFIPASSVASNDLGESVVWVFDPKTGSAATRVVKTGGIVDGRNLSVLDGLAEGETIVAAGIDFLTPGMKLRPMKKSK